MAIAGECIQLAIVDQGRRLRDDFVPFAFGRDEHEFCRLASSTQVVLRQGESTVEVCRKDRFNSILLSAKDKLLVTEGWSNQLELWFYPDGHFNQALSVSGGICSMALSHDGRLLAVGASGSGRDGDTSPISIFDVEGGQLIIKLEGHTHQIHGLAFGPDDTWLVSTSLDRSVRRWDLSLASGFESKCILDAELDFKNLKILNDGRVVLFFRGGIEVWNALDHCLLKIPATTNFRGCIAITPEEQSILITSNDHIEEWSLTTGALIRRIQADVSRPLRLPTKELDTRIKATAGANIWQHDGHHFIHVGDGPRGWVTPLNLSEDGKLIALPCANKVAIVTVAEHPQVIARGPFQGQLRASWIGAEHAKFVNSEGRLFEWNLPSAR